MTDTENGYVPDIRPEDVEFVAGQARNILNNAHLEKLLRIWRAVEYVSALSCRTQEAK